MKSFLLLSALCWTPSLGSSFTESIDCYAEKLDELTWDVNATVSSSREWHVCQTLEGRALDLVGAPPDLPVPAQLVLLNVTVNWNSILYSEGSSYMYKEEKERKLGADTYYQHTRSSSQPRTAARGLAQSLGTNRAMLIRVSLSDNSAPTKSANYMMGRLFYDTVSLASQMEACSWGALRIVPSPYPVFDIRVNIGGMSFEQYAQQSSYYPEDLVKAANEIVLAQLRSRTGNQQITLSDVSEQQFYVLPELGNWVAYASLGGSRSVYNGNWFNYLSTKMHEAAHNYLLYHANEDGEYQDYTGYMSQLTFQNHLHEDMPLQCFNAQNHWRLGWYPADKFKNIDPAVTELFRLAAFSDYDRTGPQHYIIGTIPGNPGGIYFQYNRARGVNRDTVEYPDHLVAVIDTGRGTEVLCAISVPENTVCTIPQGGRNYIIEICAEDRFSQPAQMIVSAGYDTSRCGEVTGINNDLNALQGATQRPTPAPTPSPTPFPTPSPTNKPPEVCRLDGVSCSGDDQCCSGICRSSTCVTWEMARDEVKSKNTLAGVMDSYYYRLNGFRKLLRGRK